MTRTDRTAALNAAEDSLRRIIDGDHLAAALTILADTTGRATIAAGSRDETGRRSVGSHSDPTAATVAHRLDSTARDRAKARDIGRDVNAIADTAAWLHATIAGCEVDAPMTIEAAHLHTMWCLTIPHTAAAFTHDDPEIVAQVDHACDLLDREAHALLVELVRVRTAAMPKEPKPEQKPRVRCVRCWRFGIDSNVDEARPSSGLCTKCRSFRRNHGCLPNEAICREFDARGEERARISPAMIAAAKAESRGTRKARRKVG